MSSILFLFLLLLLLLLVGFVLLRGPLVVAAARLVGGAHLGKTGS